MTPGTVKKQPWKMLSVLCGIIKKRIPSVFPRNRFIGLFVFFLVSSWSVTQPDCSTSYLASLHEPVFLTRMCSVSTPPRPRSSLSLSLSLCVCIWISDTDPTQTRCCPRLKPRHRAATLAVLAAWGRCRLAWCNAVKDCTAAPKHAHACSIYKERLMRLK